MSFFNWDLDFLVFPTISPHYDLSHESLYWFPRECFPEVSRVPRCSLDKLDPESLHEEFIPVFLYKPSKKTMNPASVYKAIIYFHGNGEDASEASKMMESLASVFNTFVIVVEYKGYGVYKGKPSEQSIFEDAQAVFRFVTKEKGINPADLIIIGRSLGSGPACHLAKTESFGALVLISPLKSIGEVASSQLKLFRHFVKDRFLNQEAIKENKNPMLAIHGQKDNLIPCSHSIDLAKDSKGITGLCLHENMTHNEFNYHSDIIRPISEFLRRTKNSFLSPNHFGSFDFEKKFHLETVSSSRCSRTLMKTVALTQPIKNCSGDTVALDDEMPIWSSSSIMDYE